MIRLLNKFDLFPAYPTTHGSESLYEKPKKEHYEREHLKLYFQKYRKQSYHYKHLMMRYHAILERKKRIQAEALGNLGQYQDLEACPTDDIESEEVDIFERVKKFEELSKRMEAHRTENMFLKGNDLRYNVYLKKMQKLTRMDMGLDVEAYKDFMSQVDFFKKFESEYELVNGKWYNPVTDANHG